MKTSLMVQIQIPSESPPSRRSVLKSLLLISGGICVAALGGSSLLGVSSNKEGSQKSVNTNSRNNDQFTSITIKVVYFGMSTQMTGTKEEYFTLTSPVYLNDILARIKQDHVVLAPMLSIMQIVVNGVPTQDNPLLQDKTEVDLIPVYAGG